MLVDPLLTTRPPQLAAQDAESLARRVYGLELRAHEFSCERDRNFRMDAADGSQFLLKIFNPAEARDIALLLAFLASADNRYLVGQVPYCDGGTDVIMRGDAIV